MTINLTYPTCWDEVTADQLDIIARALSKKLPRNTMLLFLLCSLAGIRILYSSKTIKDGVFLFSVKGKPWRVFPMNADIIATACKELEYLLDSIGLPECPLPGINRCLYDIPFEHYYSANALFSAYAQNNEPSYLRESARALSGKKQSKKIMKAYALWFTGVQHYLKGEYPHIFTEGEESDDSPAKQLHNLLSILNNDSPQLDRQILQSDVHSVLRALDNKLFKIKHHDN